MSKSTQHDNQAILFKVEDNYNVPETTDATSVVLVDNFESDPYTGDTEVLETYCKKGGVSSRPELMSNQHSTCSFGMPLTFPTTPGNLASWMQVLRCCNLDATLLTDSVELQRSALGSSDSGTLRRLMEYDDALDHEYISSGARGTVNLTIEHQKRPRFEISGMMGSYHRPELAAIINPDCEMMLVGLAENLLGVLVNEITLDGHSLCTKKITVNNLGGATLTRDGLLCPDGDQTTVEEAQTTIDIEFENSDWATEFNPFALSEAHESIQSVPFIFDHGVAGKGIKLECTSVQPTKPKVIKMTGGRKGISMQLLCTSAPKLTIY